MSDYAQWLVGIGRRIGFSRGDSSTGFCEINAWCDAGIPLMLWERETIASMSSTYVSAQRLYRKNQGEDDSLPPWMPEGKREKLEQQIADFEEFNKR